MPIKVFVDTNVLLNQNFHPEDYLNVATCITCIEEIDGLKKSPEIGYQARDATKKLKNATNVEIKIEYDNSFNNKFLEHKNDNTILGFAYKTWENDNEFVFLTDDFNLWLKSKAISLPCELFEFKDLDDEIYNGIREVWLTERDYIRVRDSEINQLDCFPNEYIIINNTTKDEQYLYMWNSEYLEEVKVKPITNKYLNATKDAIVHFDIYQKAFIHMLQNENVRVMITDSGYGCGKTHLMLHWALQQLGSGNGKYKKIYFVKSDSPPKGRKEFPAIPGGVAEKCEPLMGVILDTTSEESMSEFSSRNSKVEILPIQHVKGRSLRETILYINECQDFTPSEMERLLSRVGEDTVVLIDGSTKQIDNKNCGYRNGLSVVSKNFRDKSIAAQVNMVNDYRSEISKIVSEMDWSD